MCRSTEPILYRLMLIVGKQNGLEAVDKLNHDSERYDLIFMDIIMPQLDGVSATAMIRMVAPRIPIIAMTSNIRQEDIQTYFQFGKAPRVTAARLG